MFSRYNYICLNKLRSSSTLQLSKKIIILLSLVYAQFLVTSKCASAINITFVTRVVENDAFMNPVPNVPISIEFKDALNDSIGTSTGKTNRLGFLLNSFDGGTVVPSIAFVSVGKTTSTKAANSKGRLKQRVSTRGILTTVGLTPPGAGTTLSRAIFQRITGLAIPPTYTTLDFVDFAGGTLVKVDKIPIVGCPAPSSSGSLKLLATKCPSIPKPTQQIPEPSTIFGSLLSLGFIACLWKTKLTQHKNRFHFKSEHEKESNYTD